MIRFGLWICLPIPLFSILFLVLPLEERRSYGMIMAGKACENRGNWIYNRLHRPTPIDMAFIGSSHTFQSINEDTIALYQGMAAQQVANLAFCVYGRDMQYLFLKKLLKRHHPKVIVLEVRAYEAYLRHPDFGCFCSPIDCLESLQFKHRKRRITEVISCRARTIQQAVFRYPHDDTNIDKSIGFREGGGLVEPEKWLKEIEEHQANEMLHMPGNESLPFYYLEKIATLCKDRNIKLVFVYLPNFASAEKPSDLDKYERMGKVFIPPHDIIVNPNNYYEYNHMNTKGAGRLSKWLGGQL